MVEKIKIKIAGRMYPLTVNPNEEIFIRNAGKKIQNMIINYEKNFAVTDKQDALAMCTLQLASQIEELENKNKESQSITQERIESLSSLIDQTLQK